VKGLYLTEYIASKDTKCIDYTKVHISLDLLVGADKRRARN
jgi:hypothetical protein